jgi:PAS domain S-box-containing protein
MAFDLDQFCRTLAHEAPDAIVYADSEGVIRFWNKGAERIFGFAEAEAVGRSLDLIIPERLRQAHWNGFHQVMHTGQTRYGAGDLLSVPSLHKDGRRLSIEFTVLPIRDAGGRLVGIGAVLRDATRRFEEMKTLRRELTAAQRAAQGKMPPE